MNHLNRPRALKRSALIMCAVALLVLHSQSVQAASFTFTFDMLADGAQNAAVQTYMNTVLGCVNCVTISGAVASKTYTGDGHVVGSGGTSQTLGPDTFLKNVGGTTEIAMNFTSAVYGVSFDYEIFPDGTCADGTVVGKCGTDWPDFTFMANGATIFNQQAVMPGNPGAASLHSPASGTGTEKAPQYLGQSGNIALNGVTKLEFVDWPATIGIDNLVINTTPPTPVPEPATMLLLGTGFASFVARRRRKTAVR